MSVINIETCAVPFLLLGVAPALDQMSGTDPTNPPDENPIQYAGFVVAFRYIATQDISILGKMGLALSVGASTCIAINTAPELAHKKPNVKRWLSRITLAPTAYGHSRAPSSPVSGPRWSSGRYAPSRRDT